VQWHLDDEDYADPAAALLADYQSNKVALVAPDHIRYEVPSAIRVAARSNRLTRVQGRAAISHFFSWSVPTMRVARSEKAGIGQV
jgi:predicted nucleic acid-binding protein